MFNILSNLGNANQNTFRFHLTPVRTAKNNNPSDSLGWTGYGIRIHSYIAYSNAKS